MCAVTVTTNVFAVWPANKLEQITQETFSGYHTK